MKQNDDKELKETLKKEYKISGIEELVDVTNSFDSVDIAQFTISKKELEETQEKSLNY